MRVPRLKRVTQNSPVLKLAPRRQQKPRGVQPAGFFSASRVMADIEAIVAQTRWMTTPRINRAARYIKDQLAEIKGLADVELAEFPSDGRTAYGGWVMPKSWDVKDATLKVVPENGDAEVVLANYRDNPFSLMMWSPPTPRDGVEAPVAIVTEPFKRGGALKGKFVLMALPQMAQPHLQWAAECGAVGVISDTVITSAGIKEGRYLDEAVQYWNYTNPQWDGAPRLPAFGLTPALGRRLRALLVKNPRLRLRANVNARLYDGTLPLVTARLPGASRDEFVLTAHMDEPGASDNASGTALAIEMLRCMAAAVRAGGAPPAVSIRFYASVEARGLQAFLNTRPRRGEVVGGFNLDMLGYDHTAGRTCLEVLSARPASPSALEAYFVEACQREARRAPAFKWKLTRHVAIDDCHFAGAPFHAPMLCLEQAPDKTYHCSLDTPEKLSPSHLKRIGAMVLDTLTFFTGRDFKRIEKFGAQMFARYAERLARAKVDPRRIVQEAKTVFAQLNELFPIDMPIPTIADVASMRQRKALTKGYLHPRYAFAEKAAAWTTELTRQAERVRFRGPEKEVLLPLPKALVGTASKLVPKKQFSGYLAFEDLSKAERKKLLATCGLGVGWGVPTWLQWALDLCTGKRTLFDIYSTIASERKIKLKQLIAVMRFLEARGHVRFRTVLSKADVLAAIRNVGIRPGDLIVAHSALSDFGYLEGGADALIDCLLEVVGPSGTVCVPTHSLNWVGKPPYDPKTSPSYTGAVPAAFLRRPDAQRSLHPTHSVAAIGPRAQELLAGHDHNVAPQAREGFWGKFVDAGGKVLMLCRLQSNTLLHGGELWGGVPYPPCVVHFLQNGQRVEASTPGMPWHVHTFDLVHTELRSRGRLHSSALGESTIYAMEAREAIDTMLRIITRDPYLAAREKCDCVFCKYIRTNLKRAGIRQG